MAIFGAFGIIRVMCLFHLSVAYYLFTAPRIITDQNFVHLFGEAMELPEPTGFAKPSSATAFAAVILAIFAISDLLSLSADEEVSFSFWSNQLPIRLMILFGLTGYTYVYKPGGIGAAEGSKYHHNAGDLLKNRLMFTWGFFESSMFFWAYLNIRQERREVALRLVEKRKAEAEQLGL
ncbi:uncharacterized protein K452DRAFT_358852 [Aplosporella prunicola CBS 121167]|uniref:Increased loss of mitochondrial DNA protein 1 n=1 Tax=Aplosporella prunicola CBS 121167 TaxID=1176127 RepID=A0A6A6BFR3_9PEZI|nr:uncharacterized protein K452DRAFT_358852 [Aplosporella prunicola CBS 121167]KAF2141757.1 hypothetical protein K452DRAFT_358852 [Aplosporella prunicola CBS 121167]